MVLKNIARWIVPGNIWRGLVALADWRMFVRKIVGKPIVDAVFVTNMRDETDRKRFNGTWHPVKGHSNGPRYVLGNTVARVRAIDSVTGDLISN